ncbi:atrial natriuretic peptide receptor 1-like protein [Dinothrombium tinctorium]|uniref:guanylate cyclase n=1 Tax=Dinothrombium tinctorium TaxID=1965070 RepID=A0A3S3Q5F3_9ACAR|nr:atrial natriuretic peptide receptor 1-like protein [Dinothrombium tinctorium]RWS14292.1 atrial natriuretic peptide receptor 1-like protein [Dinothrombium tinctorium]
MKTIFIFAAICLKIIFCTNQPFPVELVGIFVTQPDLPLNYDVLRPTMHIAARDAQKRYKNLKMNVVVKNDTDSCYGNLAPSLAAEEYYARKVSAFIGPACNYALDQVARLASHWNIPIFTAGGWGAEFADKKLYQSLTRLSFSLDKICHFFVQILRQFDWHHVSMIVDESDLYQVSFSKSLDSMFKLANENGYTIRINQQSFDPTSNASWSFKKFLVDSRKNARIFIILTKATILRDILLTAHDLGMNTNEYAFLTVELIKDKDAAKNVGWYKVGDRRNKIAKKIYESLMVVSVKSPTTARFNTFVTDVVQFAREKLNQNIHIDEINPIVAAFYDTIQMFSWSLNKTLMEEKNPMDGRAVSRQLWNNTFYEGDILINANGDREADYTLSDLDPDIGIFRVVANYYGSRNLYEQVDDFEIHWPENGKGPPPDVPYCGFTGDAIHCLAIEQFPPAISISIVIFTLIGFGGIVTFFINKKLKLEARLADDWWKINFSDIKIYEKGAKKSTTSISTVDSSSRGPRSDASTIIYTPTINLSGVLVGDLHGLKVAVKQIDVKKLHINREIRIELKQVRETLHDNLVRFIGIAMDETNPNYYIITELATRGSLNDVLENEAMNIDQEFKYAMINDIVEGMLYLHKSPILYHGHLKSTNLVLDSRFTVKICDYGLRSIYRQIDRSNEVFNPRQLFWTAPEHLREKNPLISGSPKGDIYSFAIILQEIMTRSPPYESIERVGRKKKVIAPEEILDKLRIGTVPPFRPEIASDECPFDLLDLMKVCWAENPNERPDFPWIKSRLRKVTKGVTSKNYLANLLKKMEDYSDALQKTVDEREKSVVDEKKKTEELLHQILPKFVAEELKHGRHIKPESFDSVTIYFSDVVGFSDLAAESNPDEVVELLNDLYSTIDGVIATYDAFKVETITDAYLVASGLPVRNGNNHANEIAKMALAIRNEGKGVMKTFWLEGEVK